MACNIAPAPYTTYSRTRGAQISSMVYYIKLSAILYVLYLVTIREMTQISESLNMWSLSNSTSHTMFVFISVI